MPHNMDEPLRQLGMPVMLKRGVVTPNKTVYCVSGRRPFVPGAGKDIETFQLQAGGIQANIELLLERRHFFQTMRCKKTISDGIFYIELSRQIMKTVHTYSGCRY